MSIVHVTEDDFQKEIESSNLVLVDFFANWCGPCKMLLPVLESVALKKTDLKILKVNVDECETLARKYGVMSIPTLILFKEGNIISSQIGFMGEDDLISWIDGEK